MATPLSGTTEKPAKSLVLEGPHIKLQPVSPEEDALELYQNSHGSEEKEAVWKYLWQGPYKSVEDFKSYLKALEANESTVAFTVKDKKSNRKIGIVTYLNIVPNHKTIEIGGIWYIVEFQRTYANTESSFLLIQYAFEELKYRRVEWKCDSQNQKSKAAALRLGFTFEGIFRQHMIIKGRNRDSAWLSIIDSEWEQVKKKLLESINR